MWWICFPVILGVLLIMYITLGAYIVKQALYVKKRSADIVHAQDVKFGVPDSVSILPFERVETVGSDGYTMVASYMKARTGESHKYFIICHGFNSNRITCNKYANILLDIGYNTLCPDMRRCGETGGKNISFGIRESEDIELWMDYIKAHDSEAEISLYGISLGAASVTMVASRRDDIKMLVSYCSYASRKEIMIDRMRAGHLPRFFANMLYSLVSGYMRLAFPKAKSSSDIRECIKLVKCPIIILHSTGDRFTNIRHAYMLHETRPDATMVVFEGAPHARSYGVYQREYREAIEDFVHAVEKGEKMEDRYITREDGAPIISTTKEDDNMTL